MTKYLEKVWWVLELTKILWQYYGSKYLFCWKKVAQKLQLLTLVLMEKFTRSKVCVKSVPGPRTSTTFMELCEQIVFFVLFCLFFWSCFVFENR